MDNPVGSLTYIQKSVVIGSILGDGYLRCVPQRKDAFLEINHSYSQKEYVDWKFSILSDFVRSRPKSRKGNGNRKAYRFTTQQMPIFTHYLSLFYREDRVKIIPPSLELNPLMLAVWYMDDGSKCRESDVYLNTQQFSIENQMYLLRALKNVGLDARLNKDKEYHRIRFLKKSIPTLFEMISPHVITSMKYKVSNDPVETTRRSPTIQSVG